MVFQSTKQIVGLQKVLPQRRKARKVKTLFPVASGLMPIFWRSDHAFQAKAKEG
jgi:hypothetical protein